MVAFGSDESGGQGQQSPESVTKWFLVREAGLLTSLEVGKPNGFSFAMLTFARKTPVLSWGSAAAACT